MTLLLPFAVCELAKHEENLEKVVYTMKAAYIHIPFCEHICHYCDFNKVFLEGQPVDEYVRLLIKEMELALQLYPTAGLETIFVGGGTPTALDERQLAVLCEGIRKYLPFSAGEFTFEANPGDLSLEKLKILADYGVNRLSFGVQSFNDELLAKIGRSHRVKDVYSTLDKAAQAGFTNISLDLIYALPGQSEEDFSSTLKEALSLGLPHYSSYSLIIEPKTVFYNLKRKGKLKLPGEDAEAKMFAILQEEMEGAGYHQYEISNFCKPGFESMHNLVYWDNESYFGFGAGAHGYVNGVRYSNHGPLKKYMMPIQEQRLPRLDENIVTEKERMEEEMFLGLRKTEGVGIERFKDKFGASIFDVFPAPLADLEAKGLLEQESGRVKLTKKGRFLGNEAFQAFLL